MFELQKWLFSLATADLKDFASGASAFSASAALAIATLFGSVHALMPGHGKLALVSIFIFVGCTMLLRERALRFFERTASARERIGRALEIMSALMIVTFGLWLFATRAT